MLVQIVVCPACDASFKFESSLTGGATAAKCPQCGESVPLNATATSASATSPSAFPETASVVAGAGASDAPTDSTLVAPSGPPPSADYQFLAPPQKPDELGRLGQYRVLSVLGTGGMGVVFRAEDPALRRQIALKVMLPQYASHPAAKARFLREARSQAAVEHNHIIAIYQVAEERDIAYITMPFLKGQTLADALKANPNVPVGEAVRIAREMAEGLAAAHEKGLIHRDIKPANIWLEGKNRQVKVLDFGLARAEADADETEPVTQQGAIIGTPAYMSPEQAAGEPLDVRTDLFSLGVVLYQMLTGRQPFTGKNTPAILVSVTTHNPPRPAELNPKVPTDLDALTMRLLAKAPVDRPASAEAVVDALREVESEMNVTGRFPVVSAFATAADPWGSVAVTEPDSEPAAEAAELAEASPVCPKRRRWVLVASLLAFVVAGVAAADIIIKVKNKDGSETEIKVPDGSTVTVTKDGKEVAKIGPKVNPDPEVPADPDRKAAAYVLSVGGSVGLGDGSAVKELPKGPFRLTLVNFNESKLVNDEGLVAFKGCKHLTWLNLNRTQIGNEGLAYFKGCTSLTDLALSNTRVTDTGLAHFKDCKNLTSLSVGETQVSDVGLAYFKDCQNWRSIGLYATNVTDAGLANFKDCQNLTNLDLSKTQVSEAGLVHFKDCKNLKLLYLHGLPITDKGLSNFKDCKQLLKLTLDNTQVTDVGLS